MLYLLIFLSALEYYTLASLASTISTTNASSLPLSTTTSLGSQGPNSHVSSYADASGIDASVTTTIHQSSSTYPASTSTESAASPNRLSTINVYDVFVDLSRSYTFKGLVSMLEDHDMPIQEVLNVKLSESLFEAAKLGNLRVIRYLVEKKHAEIKSNVLLIAARKGNYMSAIYLLSRCTDVDYNKLLVNAIKGRNPKLIKYLYSMVKNDPSIISEMKFWSFMDSDYEKEILVNALNDSRIYSILKDLLEKDEDYTEDYKWFMEGIKNLDMARIDQDYGLSGLAFEIQNPDSVTRYKVEKSMIYLLLGILMDHGFYSYEDLCLLIPKAYRQAIMKFADLKFLIHLIRDKNLKPGKEFLDDSAKYGNLELVRYLIEQMEIDPNYNTMFNAVCSLNGELCRYLFYNRKIIDDDETMLLCDNILSEIRDDERFVNCLSEEEIQRPLKSALRSGERSNHDKRVGFKETNQYYFVSRYLKQRSPPKKHSLLIISWILNLLFIKAIILPQLGIDFFQTAEQAKEIFQNLITGLKKSKTIKGNFDNVLNLEMNEKILKEDFLIKPE